MEAFTEPLEQVQAPASERLRGLQFHPHIRFLGHADFGHRIRETLFEIIEKMTGKTLFIVFGALLFSFDIVWAETDMQLQEKALKARELSQHGAMDHSTPGVATDKFRGVFYGYLPCREENCNGLKMTLSLNAKNNYLLVIQPAKLQNRESFEKGKYEWNDTKGIVLLTPNQEAPRRQLAIKDEGTLLVLGNDGGPMPGNQDRYLLQRSDKANHREMHIH